MPRHRSTKEAGWKRYKARHAFQRVIDFPKGITCPGKIRIYQRSGHYLLQWWSSRDRKNVSQRVDGDLVTAISKAREIEAALGADGSSGIGNQRRHLLDLIEPFRADLKARVGAGEISPATFNRYSAALSHFVHFATLPKTARDFPMVNHTNREFALRFAAFLRERPIAPNGHPNTTKRTMRSGAFVLDVARALFEWAIDPDRGALLPEAFRNPFRRNAQNVRQVPDDPTRPPDITVEMATEFLRSADDYALRLFAPLLLFGLRATEPRFLFGEHVQDSWLLVPNLIGLAYFTKGKRDKKFPLVAPLSQTLGPGQTSLLFVRRQALKKGKDTPLLGLTLEDLVEEFRRRQTRRGARDAMAKQELRDAILHEAGAISYDDIHAEFQRLARRLEWPRQATLKDFRHLFATSMANAGMPEPYRRYLMGHAPGREAIVRYTHLDKLREHYERALHSEFAPVLEVLKARYGKFERPHPVKPCLSRELHIEKPTA